MPTPDVGQASQLKHHLADTENPLEAFEESLCVLLSSRVPLLQVVACRFPSPSVSS